MTNAAIAVASPREKHGAANRIPSCQGLNAGLAESVTVAKIFRPWQERNSKPLQSINIPLPMTRVGYRAMKALCRISRKTFAAIGARALRNDQCEMLRRGLHRAANCQSSNHETLSINVNLCLKRRVIFFRPQEKHFQSTYETRQQNLVGF